ncbi:hypothetical protein [Klebsiella pneumoniae]|uniref:hypothetical protein n=1 Tax=Klebsiella pneumoniae TaxID=573 RepID=UPI002418ADD5|nr:hypothetical protein [Klebsiella pneumoniae]MDG5021375.1 hypothetical protein [Klebsiella pneumoniae]HBS6405147.1 hypothetical protein [Klebsiella pneumoniae]
MNIETVNELIASLESAGELSIREQKFLKLAKAYQQLAAENVALKRVPETDSGAMLLALYSFRSESLPDVGLQKAFESLMHHRKTPATDRIVAGIKADGVEAFAAYCGEENSVFVEAKAYYRSLPDAACEFCSMLRENKSEGVKS